MLTGARAVALARIGLGVATILNAVEMHELLGRIASGRVALPVVESVPAPTTIAVHVYLVCALAAGVALTLGWRATAAAVVTSFLNLAVFLWDQQTYSSHRLLATLLVILLIFARSDATWAVRSRRGPVPAWPQLLMMTQLSACYLFAALSKINVAFLSGAPLAAWVWVTLPWWCFTAMAVGTVAVELFLSVGLWLPGFRRAALVVGVMLHLSIVVMMREHTLALLSFGVTCLSLYGLFVFRPHTCWTTGPTSNSPPPLELASNPAAGGARRYVKVTE